MTHDTAPPDAEQHGDVGAERLARVYAAALLGAADASGQTAAVIDALDSLLDDVLRGHPELEGLFAGAAVGRLARRQVLEKAFSGQADSVFVKFLMVLNEHERLDLLRPIRRAVHDLDNERQRRVKVHVYTAVPLPDDYRERVAGAVRQRFGLEPILIAHVDPSLLGGLKLRIGDTQLDATVRSRLDQLRSEIIARSSYEIQSRRDHFSTH